MKKVKFSGLNLNKQVVSKLNEDQMNQVKGGVTSIPCMIDDDSRPVLCSPDLPKTIKVNITKL